MKFLRQLLIADRWLPLRRGGLIVIWATLVILTHIPVPQAVQELGVSDKLVHLIAYFPLGLLLPTCRVPGCRNWGKCLLVIALCAALDELLQIPVHRHASVFDWLADLAGAAAGSLTLWTLAGRSTPATTDSPSSTL